MTNRRLAGQAWTLSMLVPAGLLLLIFFVWPMVEVALLVADPEWAGPSELLRPAYVRDLWFTVVTSILAAALSVGLAFVLVTTYHGRSGVTAVLIVGLAVMPLLVPHLIAAYAIRLMLAPSGPLLRLAFGQDAPDLIITPVALMFALVWKFLPFAYLNARAARSAIQPELLEAAADVGISARTRWRQILLPLMAPGLLAGGVLVGVLAAAQFSITLVVYGGRRTTTIPMDVFLLNSQNLKAEAAALGLVFAALMVGVSLGGESLVKWRTSRVE